MPDLIERDENLGRLTHWRSASLRRKDTETLCLLAAQRNRGTEKAEFKWIATERAADKRQHRPLDETEHH
jgi:hypothetical protein